MNRIYLLIITITGIYGAEPSLKKFGAAPNCYIVYDSISGISGQSGFPIKFSNTNKHGNNWTIIVREKNTSIVRTWFGSGKLPSTILFNGTKSDGTLFSPGEYYMEIIVVDKYGKLIKKEKENFKIY